MFPGWVKGNDHLLGKKCFNFELLKRGHNLTLIAQTMALMVASFSLLDKGWEFLALQLVSVY